MKLTNLNEHMWRSLALAAVLLCSALPGKVVAAETATDFPIWIELDKPQRVTVVIEDAAGRRVRNLVAETQLPAGRNRLSWDGYDDGETQKEGSTIRHLVPPGRYRARGLTSDGLRLIFEFPINSPGTPPWFTKERAGAWLADHTAPQGVVSIPASDTGFLGRGQSRVIVSGITAECGDAFMALDLEGRKIVGNNAFGWTGAYAMATDRGPNAPQGDVEPWLYCLVPEGNQVVVNVFSRAGRTSKLVRHQAKNKVTWNGGHTGDSVAAWNGLVAVSIPHDQTVLVIDSRREPEQRVVGRISMENPRGVAFDLQGRLLVATPQQVKRLTLNVTNAQVTKEEVVIVRDLEDAQQLTLDAAGNVYVGDWGRQHVVKQFNSGGKLLRTIGKPGGPQLGEFDDERMHYPKGLAVDERNQLWVAGADHIPKRISVWSTSDGSLLRSFTGGPGYGGGGTLDPADHTLFRYGLFNGGYTMRLDWTKGAAVVESIFTRVEQWHGLDRDRRIGSMPEDTMHIGTNTYLLPNYNGELRHNPTETSIWHLGQDGVAWPVAIIGGLALQEKSHGSWDAARHPGVKELFSTLSYHHLVIWSDLNRDGKAEPKEFVTWKLDAPYPEGGRFNADLSFVIRGYAMPVPKILPNGVPVWDVNNPPVRIPGSDFPRGGLQADNDRLLVLGEGVSSLRAGQREWHYPSHPGTTLGTVPGAIIEMGRYLGPPFTAKQGEAGMVFGLNGEKGSIYLMTTDGLFIQDLGGDLRVKPAIGTKYPVAQRGMVVEGISFSDEHFHPTLSQTVNGDVILIAGKEFSAIFRVDGMEAVKRREFATVQIDARQLENMPKTLVLAPRQQGRLTMPLAVGGRAPTVDGKLDDWPVDAGWIKLDHRASAAVRIVGDRLYATWRTGDTDALVNATGEPHLMFKRGGAVDLMIATDPKADPKRTEPVAGDLRLLATMQSGQPVAVLYRAVVPGTANASRIPFISPVGRVDFDKVDEVSARFQLAQQGGDIELSIALADLGLTSTAIGTTLLGDIGILRGTGAMTTQRLYWNNLNTSICSDVPSEARLQPANWGRWKLHPEGMHRRLAAVPRPAGLVAGLTWTQYTGDWNTENPTTDFTALKRVASGHAEAPNLMGIKRGDRSFAVVYQGFIDIPSDGVWIFSALQDDGVRLTIGGFRPLDDIATGRRRLVGLPLSLSKGLHPIQVDFVDYGSEAVLELSWSNPGQSEQRIPAAAFLRQP